MPRPPLPLCLLWWCKNCCRAPPAALPALGAFWAKPDAPAFAPTCSRAPPGHRRTHGLKARRPHCPGRLDPTAGVSWPGLMDLPPKEPAGTGWRCRGQAGSFGVAEDTAGVATESPVPSPPASEDAGRSQAKPPRLVQEGRGVFSSSLSSVERPALLQSLGERPGKGQAAPENLSDPVRATQGLTAAETRMLRITGEAGTRGGSAAEAHMALSGICTLVSLGPPRLPDDPWPAQGPMSGEEEGGCRMIPGPPSAGPCALSLPRGEGGRLLGQGEVFRGLLNSSLAAGALQEERDLPGGPFPAPVLESEARTAGVTSEGSPRLPGSRLEFGAMLWEGDVDVEVACEEVEEEGSAGSRDDSGASHCGHVELLEEWASGPGRGQSPPQAGSSDDSSSDSEGEPGTAGGADHTYSCLCARAVEDQKAAPARRDSRSWEPPLDVKAGEADGRAADGSQSPSGQSGGDLGLATRTCCPTSGDVPREVLEAQTGSREERGPGAGGASGPERSTTLPWAGGAGDSGPPLPHGDSSGRLKGAENALRAVCPAGLSPPGLPTEGGAESCAEAEARGTDGHESFTASREPPSSNSSAGTPAMSLPQEPRADDSSPVGSAGLGTAGGVGKEGDPRKHAQEKDRGAETLPGLVRLGKEPPKEDPEVKPLPGAPSPSTRLPTHPKPGVDPRCPGQAWQEKSRSQFLANSCPADADRPKRTACQTEAGLCGPQNPPLSSPDPQNRGPEAVAFECSSLPSMSSERQNVTPVIRTATEASVEGAPKEASCHRNESPASLQEPRPLPLPASVRLPERGTREAPPPNTVGSSENAAPEVAEEPLGEHPRERTGSTGGSEGAPGGAWERDPAPKEQPRPVEAGGPSPVSAAAAEGGGPSGAPAESQSREPSKKPAAPAGQAHLQPDLLPLIPCDGRGSTKGEPPESSQRQGEEARVAGGALGVQPFRTSGFQGGRKEEPKAAWPPAEEPPSPPRAAEEPLGAFSTVASGADRGASWRALHGDHMYSLASQGASPDSALDPEETDGGKHRAGRTAPGMLGSPQPSSMGPGPSLDGRRGRPQGTGPAESPGVPGQGLAFPAGTEAAALPLGDGGTPWTTSPPESASELGSTGAQDSSESAENSERPEGARRPARPSFPGGKAPGVPSRLPPDAFPGGSPSGSSAPGPRSEGGCLQDVGGWQKQTGKEPPGSPLGSHLPAETPAGAPPVGWGPTPAGKGVEEEVLQQLGGTPARAGGAVLSRQTGTRRKARAERFWRPRGIPLGRPLGSPSPGPRASPDRPGHQRFLARSWLGSGEKGACPCGTFRGTGRPRPSEDCLGPRHGEASGPCLRVREEIRPARDHKGRPPASLWPLSKPAEGSRRAFERAERVRPGEGSWAKGPTRGGFEAPGKGGSPSAALRGSSERAPGPGCKDISPACPATPLATLRSRRTAPWGRLPQPRAIPRGRWEPAGASRRAQDPPLLRKLSLLADRLLAPAPQEPRTFEPPPASSELLPVPEKRSPLPGRSLPGIFSCLDIRLGSPWATGSRYCLRLFCSQRLAFCPLESARGVCFLGLSSHAFTSPLAFHAQADPPSPGKKLPGGSQALLGLSELPAWPASCWTFSFLLPHSCLAVGPIHKGAPFSAPPGAAKAWAGEAPGRDLRGLQTLLALLCPGGWRLWAKKRRPAHRAPGLPKPTALQVARDLKGLRRGSPSASAGLSSPSSSPGRALTVWSQQGPSEPSPLLPGCSCPCERLPGPAAAAASPGLRSSSAELSPGPGLFPEASVAAEEGARWGPPFLALSPASCPVPERACPRLGPSAPGLQACRLDERDLSPPALPHGEDSPLKKADSEKRPKKVSQIRIRKTIPRPDPNLTPMGLPRPKRLKKSEFSLEEIYTNQNYKSPPATRCLETIFEEPRERNGAWISVGHQKRKRVLEFQDFTAPRKRRARSRAKAAGSFTRAQRAAAEGPELDLLLIQKLTDLEASLATQEEPRGVPGS